MQRTSALTIKYNSILDEYLGQDGIESSIGKCPQLSEKVCWIENYDKSIYTFLAENNLIPIANFRAYYFDNGIVSVNEHNYLDHVWNYTNFETNILAEWLPKEDEL